MTAGLIWLALSLISLGANWMYENWLFKENPELAKRGWARRRWRTILIIVFCWIQVVCLIIVKVATEAAVK